MRGCRSRGYGGGGLGLRDDDRCGRGTRWRYYGLCDGRGCTCDGDWRLRDHGAGWRTAGDGGGCRRSDDVRLLPGLRNDAARCGGFRSCMGRCGGYDFCRACCRGSVSMRMRDRRRGCDYGLRARRRGSARRGFGLLALEDCLKRVAGLGDVLEIEARPGFDGGLGGGGAAAAAEVGAYPLRLVFLDGTGVGLSRNANCFQRIENRPAFYFQFSRQIVDSNFAHPSLFSAPAALAAHISLMLAGISIVSLVPYFLSGIAAITSPGFLVFVASPANHVRFRPYLALRPKSPGSAPPVGRLRRYRVQSALRGHRYR